MFSAPISFDRQDEGHTAHGPLSWKVIENHYIAIGNYPHKKYNNTRVLTGPFGGTQSNNKEKVIKHYVNYGDWNILLKIRTQKKWQQ
jgi:hypothetical protein